MLNISYERDYKNNYLVIENSRVISDSYQLRMIVKNNIKGLLKCKERLVNGEGMICYEITSKQSVKNIFGNRIIGFSDLKLLFSRLKQLTENIHKYILSSDDIILSPDYIFIDMESNEYYFLYHPFNDGDNMISDLFEFLTNNLDNEDTDAAELVYQAMDMAQTPNTGLDDILERMGKYLLEEKETNVETQKQSSFIEFDEEEENICEDEKELSIWDKLKEFLFGKKENKSENEDIEDYWKGYVPTEEKVKADDDMTVYIPWNENSENKLYGISRNNKNHIDLSKLPITVGKLSSVVDYVISDNSISRMHVKFHKDGSKISMTDLNSTNGTFKNGMRLSPNETVVIEPGDEIGIGKLKFMYR